MVVVQLSRWIMASTVPKVGMSFVDIMKSEMLFNQGSWLLWHIHMWPLNQLFVSQLHAHNPTDTGLVCDLAVSGLWSAQTEALIDCRTVNTDTQSYAHRSVKFVLESTAAAKKTKHRQACHGRRADFSPFVCSSDGAVHREGVHVLKRVAAQLAAKWGSNYCRTMSFVRQRLSVATLWASVHCVRGARKKLAPLHLDDGATLPLFS